MFKTLIIDDESLAREELFNQLQSYEDIQVIGEAANAIEGMQSIRQGKPDVIFLDIQMPQITGLDLLAMLDTNELPYIIFVTAYDDYAIQAFEQQAFDYLLKPISDERLKKTIERLRKNYNNRPVLSGQITTKLDLIPCLGYNRILVVPIRNIEFAFSDCSGVHLQTDSQVFTSQLSLKQLEEKTTLLRCHRQSLINTQSIREIRFLDNGLAEIITVTDHVLPVSRRYLKTLKAVLGVGTP